MESIRPKSRAFKTSIAFVLAVFLAKSSFCADINWVKALTKMYRTYPSSRVLTDSERLYKTMKLIDPLAAIQFKSFCLAHHSEYESARESALRVAGKPKPTWGKAQVVGLSGGGSIATRVLSESGYQVEAYESRANPTREVQWGARQSFLDAMHFYFGNEVGNQFYSDIARPIGEVYKHMNHDFHETSNPLPEMKAPNSPSIIDNMHGKNIVTSNSVAAVTVKDAETVLRRVESHDPNVHLHIGVVAPSFVQQRDGRFSSASSNQPPPDIIVLAEGAGGKVSASLGFKKTAMSPERLQVAGVIYTDIPGGNAIGSEIRLPGSNYKLVSGSLHRVGSGKVWFVTDLDPKAIEPSPKFHPGTPEYDAEKSRLVEKNFRNIASFVLKIPPKKMETLKITGATGVQLQPFKMQLNLSTRAVKDNVIQIGDTVGNGHWSVGAGAMIAMTAHPDALANYVNDIQRGVNSQIAKESLNKRLLSDTRAWIRAGISRFWPDLPPQEVTEAFDRAIKTFDEGGVTDFQALLGHEIGKIQQNAPALSNKMPRKVVDVSSHATTEEWEVAFTQCFRREISPSLAGH
jgi:hypothetical protein